MRSRALQQQPPAAAPPSNTNRLVLQKKCACPEVLPDALLQTSAAPSPAAAGKRSALFELVKSRILAEASAGLAPTRRSPDDCPYLNYWLHYYEGQDDAHVERAIRKYTGSAATTPEALADAAAARVRRAVATWVATGQVAGVPSSTEIRSAMSDETSASSPSSPSGGRTASADSAGGGPALLAKAGSDAGASVDPAAVRSSLGAGSSLEGPVRARMEGAFGQSFGDVRVHTGGTAEEWNRRLSARAFTVGTDVAFGRGEYRPGTLHGDLLLAHELAHVAQQRGGGVPARQSRDAGLEAEADRAAASAMGLLPEELEKYPQPGRGLRLQRCDLFGSSSPDAGVTAAPTGSASTGQSGASSDAASGAQSAAPSTAPTQSLDWLRALNDENAPGHANNNNVINLAYVIMSEASVGNQTERTCVAWTIVNRMHRGGWARVQSAWARAATYARGQAPNQDMINLARDIFNGRVPDPTGGATHFYSPRGMAREGAPVPAAMDCSGGYEQVDGLDHRTCLPGWAAPGAPNSFTPAAVSGVRPAYYKFYIQPGTGRPR